MNTVILKSPGDIFRLIEAVKNQDYPIRVEIKPYKKSRSLEQNSLYWMWLTVIRDHVRDTTGKVYGTEDLHDLFRDMFLPKTETRFKDRVLIRPKSTTKLTVGEMAEYLGQIEMYCADRLGLMLPRPEEYHEAVHG